MKKELVCEYCNNEITLDDKKCPNCGANCSKVIKEYQKTIEQERQEELESVAKKAKPKLILSNLFGIGVALFIIGLIILAGVSIFKAIKSTGDFGEGKTGSNKASVGYQEKARAGELEATLLSYDLFEYKSDHFDHYNTKSGYQKIAFEFEVKNLSDMNNDAEITLKADGYNVSKTALSIDSGFATLVQGKSDYPKIDTFIIDENDTQKGYVGFEVPKDKKELLFRVGDYITIKMDNPVYNK